MKTIGLRPAVLCVVVGVVAHFGPACATEPPPNIVVILTDDLDAQSLETAIFHGLMPHLTRHLVDAGIRFRNSFATTPVCCPSRATYLTGRYAHNHGARNNSPSTGLAAVDDSSTVATWLHAAGYRTCHAGKYLNAYGAYTGYGPDYVPPGWDVWRGCVDPTTYQMYDFRISHDGTEILYPYDPSKPHFNYQTDVLAELAADFIRESDALSDSRPFFLTVTPLAVHNEVGGPGWGGDYIDMFARTLRPAPRHVGSTDSLPLPTPPSFDEADVSDKPAWVQGRERLVDNPPAIENVTRQYRDRLAALRAVDDLVGTVVAALQDAGELERTIIVFTADNGWFLGEHRLTAKMAAYEESARVPLYVRVPGLAGPRTEDRLVLNTDLAPTLAELAGASPSHVPDGRSLVPLFDDAPIDWRGMFLIEYRTHVPGSNDVPTYAAVRTGDSARVPDRLYVEYTWWESFAKELYHLNADPYQLHNRSQDPVTLPERTWLSNRLSRLRSASGEGCRDAEAP